MCLCDFVILKSKSLIIHCYGGACVNDRKKTFPSLFNKTADFFSAVHIFTIVQHQTIQVYNTIQYNTIPCISPGDVWHDSVCEDQHRFGNKPSVRGKNRGVHQGENRGMLSQRLGLKVWLTTERYDGAGVGDRKKNCAQKSRPNI